MKAEKAKDFQEQKDSEKGKSTIEKIENTLNEEIIIGICCPLGARRDVVKKNIEKILQEIFRYKSVETIRLSNYILEYEQEHKEDDRTPKFQEIRSKITGGDKLREKYGNSVLVDLAIKKINNDRMNLSKREKDKDPTPENLKSRRQCYIIDSIKNIEELHLLRKVYKENFFLISVYTPEQERIQRLSKEMSEKEIKEILDIDDHEEAKHGQKVRKVFVDGDLILRVSYKGEEDDKTRVDEFNNEVKKRLERFFHLIFETKVITPTIIEKAMYHAKSAAGNSACLSRQVGASIVDNLGNIISEGWNEVPKFGGNVYDDSSLEDKRCFHLGFCSNDDQKHEIINSIAKTLLNNPKISSIIKGNELMIGSQIKETLNKSRIKDLIEYSRSVHAEMNAIIKGAQLSSNKMRGGMLFTTTYPCHNCARHIVFAGIQKVYFIEPYPKSKALELHNDSLSEDEASNNKVIIQSFDGVGPRRFLEFFSNLNDRKDKETGKLVTYDFETAKPKSMLSLQALSRLEEQAIHTLNEQDFFNKQGNSAKSEF